VTAPPTVRSRVARSGEPQFGDGLVDLADDELGFGGAAAQPGQPVSGVELHAEGVLAMARADRAPAPDISERTRVEFQHHLGEASELLAIQWPCRQFAPICRGGQPAAPRPKTLVAH
jgi:hypothetical protein